MPPPKSPATIIAAAAIVTPARQVDIGIVGDCKMVLSQLLTGIKGKLDADPLKDWRQQLADGVAEKAAGARR